MWSTMATMTGKLQRDQNAELGKDFISEAFGDPKFIYFQRNNKVAQAISHVVLTKTSISHARNDNELKLLNEKKASLVIENEDITKFLRKTLADELHWANFFKINGIEPLRISYEDFCVDVPGRLNEVASFLEAKIDPSAAATLAKGQSLRKTRSTFEQDLAVRYLSSMVAYPAKPPIKAPEPVANPA